MAGVDLTTFVYALMGGILPALVWLWFWLHEDGQCPEPAGNIGIAFLAGMLAVVLVLPVERFLQGTGLAQTPLFILWAIVEEAFKFIVAYFAVLRLREFNEPVDAVMYMITVALGFAALENALFLLAPIQGGMLAESVLTGNLRFLGATLLHTLCSATIGIFLAFSFYQRTLLKEISAVTGLILASTLHAAFNFSIMAVTEKNGGLFVVFLSVWAGIIVLILLFEKIKNMSRSCCLTVANCFRKTPQL